MQTSPYPMDAAASHRPSLIATCLPVDGTLRNDALRDYTGCACVDNRLARRVDKAGIEGHGLRGERRCEDRADAREARIACVDFSVGYGAEVAGVEWTPENSPSVLPACFRDLSCDRYADLRYDVGGSVGACVSGIHTVHADVTEIGAENALHVNRSEVDRVDGGRQQGGGPGCPPVGAEGVCVDVDRTAAVVRVVKRVHDRSKPVITQKGQPENIACCHGTLLEMSRSVSERRQTISRHGHRMGRCCQ